MNVMFQYSPSKQPALGRTQAFQQKLYALCGSLWGSLSYNNEYPSLTMYLPEEHGNHIILSFSCDKKEILLSIIALNNFT